MTAEQRPDIETLALAIARSRIVVAHGKWAHKPPHARRSACGPLLPEGFEDADLAILRWIADESRRARRHLFRQ